MTQLLESKLFFILKASSLVDEDYLKKLKLAYEEFAVTLLNKLQKQTNVTKLYYHLGFVRLELIGIRDTLLDGQEKKCLENCN